MRPRSFGMTKKRYGRKIYTQNKYEGNENIRLNDYR